ncbi:hypothetical protein Sa4125_35170 [Aureimonas sp. SA4125]|uniref:copper chaperone PCu(A)C n=1 Tax=Aureimonas sp. SA4125 TaxID=2826993 RepID=UPI001CC7BECF|nr:copper chaperone PCu(A)C [Aureimonas sp. SA4125]BDA85975.1 hypothetical protein Sa4125_35170 [Aureimonas sp. SA4125]
MTIHPIATRPHSVLRALLLAGAVLGAIPLAGPVPAAIAHEYTLGTLTIDHPWSRATPPSAKTGAGYMVLTNAGSEDDRLIGLSTPAAARTEVHEMSVTDGIMKMNAVEGGLVVPAGGSVALEPGGYHVMLMGLAKPLAEGDKVPLTLTFERGGQVNVVLNVGKIAEPAPAHKHDAMAPDMAPMDGVAHAH